MNLFEAVSYTNLVLNELGLSHINVVVSNRTTKTGGLAHSKYLPVALLADGTKNNYYKITLSRKHFEINDQSQCLEIILHEIGHCLTPITQPAHGAMWRDNVRKIGGIPSQYLPDNVERPVTKYTGTCPTCGDTFARTRLSWNLKESGRCNPCCMKHGADNTPLLTWTTNF